jgi:hypothetical protein
MSAMLEGFSRVTTMKEENAVLAALADVVDEISNGAVSTRFEYYNAKRKLITSHIIKAYLNSMINLIESSLGSPESDTVVSIATEDGTSAENMEEVLGFMRVFKDLIDFLSANAERQYRRACDLANEPVDENLILNGILSERSWWERWAMNKPPAEADGFNSL